MPRDDGLLFLVCHHTAGIYHRDIGVRNLMANVDCKFKIIDFGLSAPTMPDFEGYVAAYPDNRYC